jgi:hypothetical protein
MSVQHRWQRAWLLAVATGIQTFWIGAFFPHGMSLWREGIGFGVGFFMGLLLWR